MASQKEIGRSSGGAVRGPAFLLLLFMLPFVETPACAGVYWPAALVLASNTGQYTSLELDTSGAPHIAYHDYTNRDVCYAWRSASGVWTFELVDASGDVGRFASLELSSDGEPRIAYLDFTNGRLKYAEKRQGVWSIEALSPFPCCGWYSSLALDSADRPRIAFSSCSSPDLYFGSRDSSGQWTFETVDGEGDVGLYCSLRLHEDLPRISYYDRTNGHLKFAEKGPAGNWAISLVDASSRCGIDTSLALDSSGEPYISYWDQQNGDLKCAFRQGGIWTVETVDSEGGGYESCMNVKGRPRISYEGASGLRYAERVDGCWRIYRLEDARAAAAYTSLVLDESGNPRISCFNVLHETLEYREGVDSTATGAPVPVQAANIGTARAWADGTWLRLNGARLASAGDPSGWHAEAADRSAGVCLKLPQGCSMPAEGDEVEVVGVIETGPTGERRIQVCEWQVTGSPGAPDPVFITASSSLAAGLLVRIAGRVRTESSRIYLDGVEILFGGGWPVPSDGGFVVAAGVLRSTASGFVLSPRRQEEIFAVEP